MLFPYATPLSALESVPIPNVTETPVPLKVALLLIVILVPAIFVTVVFGGMPRPNTLWLTTMPVALVTVIIFELEVVVAVVVKVLALVQVIPLVLV